MKCNHCGNIVPEGSVFCNQCGTKLNTDIPCPACGESIPAKSVFCPKCGKMVRNDMDDEPRRAPRQPAQPVAQESASPRPTPHPRPQATAQPQPVQPQPATTQPPVSHYNRNLIAGVVALVAIIGLLLGLSKCGARNDRLHPVVNDSTAAVTADVGQAPMAIFTAELDRNNFAGDGATAAAAVRIPGDGAEHPDRIVGVTAMSDPGNRSFYKIYSLTQNGSLWDMSLLETKYLNGRSINLDNSALIADPSQLPRAVKVDGKDGMYFAFLNMPQGASTGRVSLCFYDIDNRQLHILDYDGQVKTRDDGRQYIYGKPLQSTSTAVMRFLKGEAASVKKIYFPTDEELKAEEEARQKEEEEKLLAGPENAAAKWSHDNGEKMEALKNGEVVTMKAQPYDKPIFNRGEIAKQLDSERYMVFIGKSGAVYGFNKDSRKYFVIYSGGASDISFGNDERELRMRTGDGHISYDLPTDKAKLID